MTDCRGCANFVPKPKKKKPTSGTWKIDYRGIIRIYDKSGGYLISVYGKDNTSANVDSILS